MSEASGAARHAGGRRLGAIMFTDLVGYSTIAEANETKALRLLEEHRTMLKEIFPKISLAWNWALAGQKDRAQRIVNEMESRRDQYIPRVWVAMVKFALGHKDEGFSLLEKAFEERDTDILYFRGFPVHREYQSDPRWLEIDRKIGPSGVVG